MSDFAVIRHRNPRQDRLGLLGLAVIALGSFAWGAARPYLVQPAAESAALDPGIARVAVAIPLAEGDLPLGVRLTAGEADEPAPSKPLAVAAAAAPTAPIQVVQPVADRGAEPSPRLEPVAVTTRPPPPKPARPLALDAAAIVPMSEIVAPPPAPQARAPVVAPIVASVVGPQPQLPSPAAAPRPLPVSAEAPPATADDATPDDGAP